MSSFKDFVKSRRGGADGKRAAAPAAVRSVGRPAPPPPAPPVERRKDGPRVVMVTTANLFVYDNSGRSTDMSRRPTGGLTLTLALARYVKRAFGARIVAVDFIFDHYEREARVWEGHAVDCVRIGADPLIAPGAYDVVIVSSPELAVCRWANEHCDARLRIAMCHDYAGAAWGPFTNVDDDKREPLYAVLAGWRLYTDSEHVAAYHRRFAPPAYEARGVPDPPTARCCYGACYGYYERATMPHYARASAEKYVTFISPCAPKGLSVLAALSPLMPTTKFLAVATAWTNPVVQHILKRFPNVECVDGSPNADDFYKRTKVLIVPSIWPEAFGLVAMEAAARGIPVVSTDHGGLAEANPVARLRIETPYFYDHAAFELVHGATLDQMMNRARRDPPADVLAVDAADADARQKVVAQHLFRCLRYVAPQDVVVPFAGLLNTLLTDDAFYEAAADDSRRLGLAFVAKHEDGMAAFVDADLARLARYHP